MNYSDICATDEEFNNYINLGGYNDSISFMIGTLA